MLSALQIEGNNPDVLRSSDFSSVDPADQLLNSDCIATVFSKDRPADMEWHHQRHYSHLQPVPPAAEPNIAKNDKIFIQIPSYRDAQLPKTIASAFERASNPDRLRFGICWQYDEWTSDDLEPWADDPRVGIDEVHYPQSKGCCWARDRANAMYAGEGYFLQIDAHMRFAPDWDDILIKMLESIDAPRPVLSTYPPALLFDEDGSDILQTNSGIQRLCMNHLADNLSSVQGSEIVPFEHEPGPSRFLAGGFNFSHGQFVEDVPSDPEVYFSGEEIALAARGFTHGYDIFYPHENVIWHLYEHEAPKHWTDTRDYGEYGDRARERTYALFTGDHRSLGVFGLGSLRTIGEYETMAGIDFRAARLGLPHVEPVQQTVRFSTKELFPMEGRCDFVMCCLLDADAVALVRVDQYDPEVVSGERTDLELTVCVAGEPTSCLISPFSQGEWGESRTVALEES